MTFRAQGKLYFVGWRHGYKFVNVREKNNIVNVKFCVRRGYPDQLILCNSLNFKNGELYKRKKC